MEKKLVLVDTDILIKVYRGDKEKKSELDKLKDKIAISVITALELYQGAENPQKIFELHRQLKAYQILHLNENISDLSLKVFKKYSVKRKIRVADCLIATTSLHFKIQLYTDNKKDFDFIDGLVFYKEK